MFSLLFFATQKLYEQYKPMKKEYINYRIIADKELLEYVNRYDIERDRKSTRLNSSHSTSSRMPSSA